MECEKSTINDITVKTILNEEEREAIVSQLNALWGSKKPDMFPGPQPISIERKHFSEFRKDSYHVGRKTDGERFALCLMKYKPLHEDTAVNISFILSRTLQIHLIRTKSTKGAHEGTIADCELIGNTLVMFDCVMASGSNMKSSPFSERLNACNSICSFIQSPDITFEVKTFSMLKSMEQFVKVPCKHKSDGFVFVPEKKGIMQGTHSTMFKWKPLIQNTIDFGILNGKVYLQNNTNQVTVNVRIDLDDVKINDDSMTIVECMYVGEKRWKGLHIRHDKHQPNGHYTYKKTLINIAEDIQESEFYAE